MIDHDVFAGGCPGACPPGAGGRGPRLAPPAPPTGDRPRWGIVHGRRATREGTLAGDGERRLMLAVLIDAAHRCRCRRMGRRDGRRGWRVEYEWLQSEDRSWPFSFASICDYLGLDSSYVRRLLLARLHTGPGNVHGRGER